MKRLIAAFCMLGLASCSTVNKRDLKTQLADFEAPKIESRALSVPVRDVADYFEEPEILPELVSIVRVKNHSDKQRLQWFTAVIPFEIGKAYLSHMAQISTEHGAVSAVPIKWHFKNGEAHSIALAKIKFPLHLAGNQEVLVPIYFDEKPNPMPFAFGPNLSAALANAQGLMFMGLKLKDDPKIYYAPMWQNQKVLEASDHSYTFRYSSNFKAQGQALGMTANWTWTVENRQDFGDMVFSLGHNDFEVLKSGGYDVEWAKLYYKKPFTVEVRKIDSYGAKVLPDENGYGVISLVENQNIADGSARTFRGLWSVILDPSSLAASGKQATLESPAYGVATPKYWEESKAGGIVGTVMTPRATVPEMRESLKHLCGSNYDVRITAYPKMANKLPSATGDQPAFGSNMMAFQQQAIVSSSSCPIEWAMHGAQVEEYRASYWWKKGQRMSWLETPKTCYFWSGRPHYASFHNSGHCEPWNSRSIGTGFVIGEQHGWGTEDDQHWGNPLLRSFYELTGDPWAGDLIKYRMSLALWNKLGDYDWQSERLGSERAVRVPYNATELMRYHPDAAVSSELLPRLKRHMEKRLVGGCFAGGRYCSAGINSFYDSYSVYGLEPIYGDPRHPLFTGKTPGASCKDGQPCEENRGIISWWTGFSMTFAYQMIKYGIAPDPAKEFIDKYMSMASFYFDETGQNAGGRRVNDWSVKENSFSQAWHSGWFSAVESYGRSHPRWDFFETKVLPTRKTAFEPNQAGEFWSEHDKWWQ